MFVRSVIMLLFATEAFSVAGEDYQQDLYGEPSWLINSRASAAYTRDQALRFAVSGDQPDFGPLMVLFRERFLTWLDRNNISTNMEVFGAGLALFFTLEGAYEVAVKAALEGARNVVGDGFDLETAGKRLLAEYERRVLVFTYEQLPRLLDTGYRGLQYHYGVQRDFTISSLALLKFMNQLSIPSDTGANQLLTPITEILKERIEQSSD